MFEKCEKNNPYLINICEGFLKKAVQIIIGFDFVCLKGLYVIINILILISHA